ncbi:hypothetical protein ACLM5H_00180 [Fredinandcohnia humi]
MTSSISIGIIGSEWTEKSIKNALRMFPSFQPIFLTSNNIYDAPTFTIELIKKVDVILYSGFTPYKLSKDVIPSNLPVHYIPLKGSSLYRAFYRLKKRVPNLNRLSIDTLKSNDIAAVLTELEEEIVTIAYNQRVKLESVHEIVEFHVESYRLKQSDGALTGLKVVAEALNEAGVPNEWILPTQEDIVVTLERALLSTEKRKNRESQIVFGIISVDDVEKLRQQMLLERQIQRMRLNLQKILIDYIEQLEGYLMPLNGEEYMFVTTRGVFERITQGYKYMPIHEEVKRQLKISLSIGIGFGYSADQAGSHARIALQKCNEHGGGTSYIVNEDRNVIGAVEMAPPIQYPLSITDPNLLALAEKSGMTAPYITKLIALLERNKQTHFTAQDLASIVGITNRSAHRILLQWLDAGIVCMEGMEKLTSKGRPRQLYKLVV